MAASKRWIPLVALLLALAAGAWFLRDTLFGPSAGRGGEVGRGDGSGPESTSLDPRDAGMEGTSATLRSGDAPTGAGQVTVRLLEFPALTPIAGQAVRLAAAGGRRLEVTSGEDGRASFSAVEPGSDWTFSVEPKRGSPVEMHGVVVRARKATDLGDLVLGDKVVLRGRVVDGKGMPVPGASVAAYTSVPPDMSKGMIAALLSDALDLPTPAGAAESDERGGFVLASLAPGTYRLATRRSGFALDVKSDLVIAPERASAVVTIVLGPSTSARGRVIDEAGSPVEGARVIALEDAGMRFRGTTSFKKDWTVTGADGRYVLDTLTRGAAYRFGVSAPAHAPVFDVGPTTVDAPLVRDFTLVRGGSIAGTVTDAVTGKPVEGAHVLVVAGNLPMGGRGPRGPGGGRGAAGGGGGGADASASSASATTAADGKFVLEGLKPGPVGFAQIHAAGYSDASASTFTANAWPDVRAGESTPVEVRLEPGGTLRGHVTTAGPNGPVPVAGAQVAVLSFQSMFSGFPTATTDADGAYRIDGIRTGTAFGVTASAPGYVAPDPMDPAAQVTIPAQGGDATKDVVLTTAGTVEGTITNAKGAPVSGARVRATPAPAPGGGFRGGGGFLRMLLPGGGGGVVLSDADGRYRLDHVASEDRFLVEAESDEHVPTESEPFQLKAGDVKKIDLVLLGGAVLHGRVIDEMGRFVTGASIRVGHVDDETDKVQTLSGWNADRLLEQRSFASADDGTYEVTRVRPGRTLLKVEHEGYVTLYRRDIVAKPDDVLENVVLALSKGDSISGVVKGEDGHPIANAFVAVTKQANPSRMGQPAPAASDASAEPTVEPTMSDRTDEQGRFTVENVLPGQGYSVLVWFAQGYRGYGQGDEAAIKRGLASNAREVEFTLKKADPNDMGGFPMPRPPPATGTTPVTPPPRPTAPPVPGMR